MNRHSPILLLFAIGILPGCIGAKTNAHRTHIERRSQSITSDQLKFPNRATPPTLSFAELEKLASDPIPKPDVALKINRLFSTPSISNKAWYSGSKPTLANNAALGDFIRIASWNIEKSLHVRDAAEAMKDEAAYKRLLKPEVLRDPKRLDEAIRQRERLVTSDILLLQEMDLGMPRSSYVDATKEIAKALGMNYSYAPQQLEIDPVPLGIEPGSAKPDKTRYKGLFGVAVLSRFPILAATSFPLQTQPYNWYEDEQRPISSLEKIRRLGAQILVRSRFQRELKIGGRIFFRVDLHIPGLPNNCLTVIHNHLEIKTTTLGREAQLKEILDHIRPIPNAVIMAGDHNSAQTDVSATSISRVVRRASVDPQTWVDTAANVWSLVPDGITLTRSILNNIKNLHNPLAAHIPLIFPNQTRRLFKIIEHHRFDDGGQFDNRGDRGRSINGFSSVFANSNERYWKGLVPTFHVPRPIGPFGRTRLDWIFVKQPSEWQSTYRFAPHFGETLEMLEKAVTSPLSDHLPIVADLPLSEPSVISPETAR